MTTVKADITAADRLLKAAVRKARAEIAEAGDWYSNPDRRAIVAMLTEAGNGAELLLGGDDA